MTYLDVQPHIHWKLKGLSNVDIVRESNLGGFFLYHGFEGGGLAPQASYAIMPVPLLVYDDYYVLTAKCAT